MRFWTGTTVGLLVVLAVAATGRAADFILTGSQHQDVASAYSFGILYDSSTADVKQDGVITSAYVNDDAQLRLLAGSVGKLWAYDTGTVDISGGSLNYLSAFNTSNVTLYGYDFQPITGDLLLEDGRVLGTGLLTGKWFDGTSWSVVIETNESGASIWAVPEPSTFVLAVLGLLGLGWYGWRRRKG